MLRRLLFPIGASIVLLLGACGAPGTSIVAPSATAVQQISDSNIEATVQARLALTSTAQVQPSAVATAAQATAVATAAQATAAPIAAQATAAPTVPAVALAPDALIAMGRNSLSVLGADGWSQPISLASEDECSTTTAGFSGSGIAYAGCSSRIYTTASGTWAEDQDLLNNYHVFSDPKGRIWIFGFKKARIIDDNNVTNFDAKTSVGEDSFSITTAAFAADGTAFFAQNSAAENELVSFDGKDWKRYGKQLGLPEFNHTDALLVTSKNELLIGSKEGIFKLNGDKVEEVLGYKKIADDIGYPTRSRFTPQINTLAETPDGVIWFGTSEEGLFAWDGSTVTAHDRSKGLPANQIKDLEVDAKGRLWVATTYGLAVRDGESWQVAEPSTSDLADSYITRIAVRGAPQLPAPAQKPRVASVVGQITESKVALPGATITLCSEEYIIGEETRYGVTKPCENHRFVANVQTDAQGKYRFDDVPLGTYSIMISDNTKGQMIKPTGLAVVALTPNQEVTQDLDYDGR